MAKKPETEEQAPNPLAGLICIPADQIPTPGSGRQPAPEVIELRGIIDELISSGEVGALPCTHLEVGTVRSLIHRAATMNGTPPVEIGTRFDAVNGRITFGAKALFRKPAKS